MSSVLQLPAHEHSHARHRSAAIPNHERLPVNRGRTGRGVTIAFLDSGFYPHPDLVEPRNRIVAFHDVTDPHARLERIPEAYAWHGTQTSVVGAGNGFLSDGIYASLAPEAEVVLVKVRGERGTPNENTLAGLRWVLENRERLRIGVVSISVGGGEDAPSADSEVDRLADELTAAGVVVVVAAGNSGCTNEHAPLSPATASSVITVGGSDDQNQLGREHFGLYCSSYGSLLDGRMKPEVIAPAAWVAAPILPGTELERRAEALSCLATAPDYRLRDLATGLWEMTGLSRALLARPLRELRQAVERALEEAKVISTHYQHVDGTSFAAPLVAGLAAQMLEANPSLRPEAVKRILIHTADRLAGADLARQGFGVVNPARALELAEKEQHHEAGELPPRRVGEDLAFFYHDHSVSAVSLAGEWNGWQAVPMSLDDHGNWKLAIPSPPPGRYRYKLLLDGRDWREDPSNDLREPDGFGGSNSVVHLS